MTACPKCGGLLHPEPVHAGSRAGNAYVFLLYACYNCGLRTDPLIEINKQLHAVMTARPALACALLFSSATS